MPPVMQELAALRLNETGQRKIMKIAFLIVALAVCASAEKPAKPATEPCVILKRMGPADQVTSHLYSFGIRGKQFQFVEGQLPEGAKFHGRLTDHDVRSIQDHGGRITVLDAHYTPEELRDARATCTRPEVKPEANQK